MPTLVKIFCTNLRVDTSKLRGANCMNFFLYFVFLYFAHFCALSGLQPGEEMTDAKKLKPELARCKLSHYSRCFAPLFVNTTTIKITRLLDRCRANRDQKF